MKHTREVPEQRRNMIAPVQQADRQSKTRQGLETQRGSSLTKIHAALWQYRRPGWTATQEWPQTTDTCSASSGSAGRTPATGIRRMGTARGPDNKNTRQDKVPCTKLAEAHVAYTLGRAHADLTADLKAATNHRRMSVPGYKARRARAQARCHAVSNEPSFHCILYNNRSHTFKLSTSRNNGATVAHQQHVTNRERSP